MLDTNVFNALLRGDYPASAFGRRRLISTGIQRDELDKTPDGLRRAELLNQFDTADPEILPAASFAFDIEGAGLDQAHWNDGTGNFERMRVRLQELDRKGKRKKSFCNQERDVLIAETAIKAGAVLVTSDVNLRSLVIEFGGRALDPLYLTRNST